MSQIFFQWTLINPSSSMHQNIKSSFNSAKMLFHSMISNVNREKYSRLVILFFISMSFLSLMNLFYQLFMVRNLNPEDYGILNALISIFVIISLPSGTLQTVITKFVSTFFVSRQFNKLKYFLKASTKKAFFLGAIVFILFLLGNKSIASFFHIQSSNMVVLVGLLMFFSLILPINLGGLLGLYRYGFFVIDITANGILKLSLGILLVKLGFNVMGALNGVLISIIIALLLSFLFIKISIEAIHDSDASTLNSSIKIKSKESSLLDFTEVYRYIIPVFLASINYTILTNIDMVLVKHFFIPEHAGYYSIGQMVGKIVLFVANPIVLIMFPEISKLHTTRQNVIPTLIKSLLMVILLCGTGSLICFYFPSFILKTLTGKAYQEIIPLVFPFAVSMSFFSLSNTLSFFFLSINKTKFIFPLAFSVIIQIILIITFHNTLKQILIIMCTISFVLFISLISLVPWKKSS